VGILLNPHLTEAILQERVLVIIAKITSRSEDQVLHLDRVLETIANSRNFGRRILPDDDTKISRLSEGLHHVDY